MTFDFGIYILWTTRMHYAIIVNLHTMMMMIRWGEQTLCNDFNQSANKEKMQLHR